MRTITNKKLRKFQTKCRNYREPQTINFSKALTEITNSLDICIEATTFKTEYTSSNYGKSQVLAKVTVLVKVKEKITEIKQKIKNKQTKPVLSDPDVKNYLEELDQKFVIVITDKTSNNFAFICINNCMSKL